MKFLVEFLKGKCLQCLVDNYKSIVEICSCGAELCEKHALFHIFKQHVKYPVEITREKEKTFLSIRKNDCSLIEGFLDVVKYMSLVHMSCNSSPNNEICMHVYKVFKEMGRVANEISNIVVYYRSSGCCICSLQVNRWMCLACGLVFCGRNRHEIRGNQHGYEHFENTQHSIFVNLDEFNPKSQSILGFCCFCGVLIRNKILYEIFTCRYIAEEGCLMCNAQNRIEGETCEKCENNSGYSVISKRRSLNYVLAVMHALSFSILHAGSVRLFSNISIKETNCEFMNSVSEVLARMMALHTFGRNGFVFVDHIDDLVSGVPDHSTGDGGMEAARFFRNFMSFLKRADSGSEEIRLSSLFYILVRSSIRCIECREKWEKSEKVCILYLKPNQSISEYFSNKQLDKACKCGAKRKTVVSSLANIPSIVTVRVRRPMNWILGEGSYSVIEENISIPYKGTDGQQDREYNENSESAVNYVVGSGLITSEVFERMKKQFMVSDISRDKKDILGGEKVSLLKYKLKASVVYQNNTQGGYYFTQLSDETGNNLDKQWWNTYIDDEVVKRPLYSEDAILLFYILVKSVETN